MQHVSPELFTKRLDDVSEPLGPQPLLISPSSGAGHEGFPENEMPSTSSSPGSQPADSVDIRPGLFWGWDLAMLIS